MREKLVKRFYCDHCNRGLFKKSAMERHESICIKNPERVCPVCLEAELLQTPLAALLAALNESMDDLRSASSGCPACMLAAIVNSGEFHHEFDYKTEMADWRSEGQPPGELHF